MRRILVIGFFLGSFGCQEAAEMLEPDEVLIDFIPALSREELMEWFASRKGNKLEIKKAVETAKAQLSRLKRTVPGGAKDGSPPPGPPWR